MVQFNLLPDIKLKYIKAQRTKHLVTFIATVASLASVAVLVLAFSFVYIVQKQVIRSLDNSIESSSATLKKIPEVDKILTVQNQLGSLTALHEQKPAASRIFGFLAKTTPQQVSLNKMQLNFATNEIVVGGSAPSLDAVKIYANALKSAKYTVGTDTTQKNAFSDVVLTNFSRDEKGATYTITSKFDPELFRITQEVTLQVAASNDSLFQGGQ